VLSRAHHLYTQCSPRIYYRPYLLLPEQSALIEEQVIEAQAQIDAEVEGTTLKRRNSPERGNTNVGRETDVRESVSSSSSPKDDEPADGPVVEE
jgi:hypothetical protein